MCLVPTRHLATARLHQGLFPQLCHLDKECIPNKEGALHRRSNMNAQSMLWCEVQAMLKHYSASAVGAPVLHMDFWYVSECFVASGLVTIQIWDRSKCGLPFLEPSDHLLVFMHTSDGGLRIQ